MTTVLFCGIFIMNLGTPATEINQCHFLQKVFQWGREKLTLHNLCLLVSGIRSLLDLNNFQLANSDVTLRITTILNQRSINAGLTV